MLTENGCAIRELSLQSFSKDWIEWLVLTGAQVQTTQREGDNLLESFQVIGSLSCLLEKLRGERPNIDNALD